MHQSKTAKRWKQWLGTVAFCALFVCITNVSAKNTGEVNCETLNVRLAPDLQAAVVGQLSKGQTIELVQANEDWFEVKLSNGENAFVSRSYVKVIVAEGLVLVDKTHFYDSPNLEATPVGQAPIGLPIDIVGIENDFYIFNHGESKAYIHKEFVTGGFLSLCGTEPVASQNESVSQGQRADVVNYAKKFLGTRYVWGGTNLSKGVDCSGFTLSVFSHFGIAINRTSRDQIHNGVRVEKANLQVGDLVFFDTSGKNNGAISHVGIYIGNGEFIHASSGAKTPSVVISSLNETYYAKAYVGASSVL